MFMADLLQEPIDSAISIAVFMAEPPQEPMDSAISIAGYYARLSVRYLKKVSGLVKIFCRIVSWFFYTAW